MLSQFWKDFLKKTGAKNCIVVVEDGPHKPQKSSKNAIGYGGENGYITYLASKSCIPIPIFCPEPSIKMQIKVLNRLFTRSEIFYFYFIRSIVQWNKTPIIYKSKFKKHILIFSQWFKRQSKWSNFDFSFRKIEYIHRRLFGSPFVNEKNFFTPLISPWGVFVTNKIAHRLNLYRDYSILKMLNIYWKRGLNIFVVYGGSHLITQEPAIKMLIKKDNYHSEI